MSQRITDLTISVLACVVFTLLSWPFWRNYEYWAESHAAWWIYFAVGFLLALYVFYVFIGSLRILFIHDTQEQAATTTNKDRLS
ncbi:MAG: hypothetical protein ABIT64_05745 [Lysobacteraceae bacterium]